MGQALSCLCSRPPSSGHLGQRQGPEAQASQRSGWNLVGTVGDTQVRVSPLSPRLSRQSPASEGEEEELLMEEEEEEVLAGVSAEDKGRRPPAKGPSEPAHPGERRGAGGGARGRRDSGAEEARDRAGPRCLAGGLALLPNFTFTARLLYGLQVSSPCRLTSLFPNRISLLCCLISNPDAGLPLPTT